MPAAERGGLRHDGIFCRVALHAGCGIGGELMAAMAARAGTTQARSPVFDIDLLVAFAAVANRFGSGLMRVVASLAGHRSVHG